MTLLLAAALLAQPEPPARTPDKPDKAKKEPAAPPACRKPADAIGTLLEARITVLADEKRKGEDADIDRGVAAFERWAESNAAGIATARKQAKTVQATLDKDARARCEKYAYRLIYKQLTRFSAVAAFYNSRADVFRRLGDLFR